MPAPLSPVNRARTILVVEGDLDLRGAICELLEDAGHIPLAAENGAAGLAILAREAVSLVLLDLQMPDMDGVEFRRRQLDDEVLRPIPVVVCTAQRPPLPEGIGDLPILYKPFDRDELVRAIRRNAVEPLPRPSSAANLLAEIAQVQQRMSRVATELSAVRDDLRARCSSTPDEPPRSVRAAVPEAVPHEEAPPSKSGTRAKAEVGGRYAIVSPSTRRKRG